MQGAVRASIERGTDYDIEYRVCLPKGEIRWLQVRGQTFYDADGKPLSMAGVTIDVTERKQVEEHRALLAEELKHRVKNTMATMQSIAHQTLRGATSLDEAGRTLDARLHSLSTAHDMLTRDSWVGAPLAEVAAKALGAFHGGGKRILVDGPDVWLPPRLTLALAMALHELATNAVKYGALSNNSGRVELTWEVAIRSEPALLRLSWEETGGPPVSRPTRAGFGSKLIERALATEMNGKAEIEYRPAGVKFTLEAPLPERVGAVQEAEFAI
jgi:two-component sensor histidine kinase